MRKEWEHLINGNYCPPSSGQYLHEIDPRSGSASFSIARGNKADVEKAATAANLAALKWREVKPLDRGRILIEVARSIRENIDELAEFERIETGKPKPQALMHIELAAQYFEFYGGIAPALEGETIDIGSGKLCYTLREPYGVIGAIFPWNAPANQFARGVAPALAAGNAVLAKPSEFTSVSTLHLTEIAHRAGLPPGCINIVTGTGTEVGAQIVDHPLVEKVVFTGSLNTGKAIGLKAANRVIPVTLELGGKSPDLVFDDADLHRAAAGAIQGFTINSGQACAAGTRILAHRSIADSLKALIVDGVKKLRVGHDDKSHIGPIITRAQFEKVDRFFVLARQQGVDILAGGTAIKSDGFFVEPTVYSAVSDDSAILREEIFGPVCTIQTFDTEQEAIEMANDTNYGLAAGIWTTSLSRAHRVASKIKAGQIYINEYPIGGVETPFGGYKQSGIGREKGREALLHYSQLKTVLINLT